jgi:transposase-like protein
MAILDQNARKRKSRVMKREAVITRGQFESMGLSSRLALIQALIPLGLMMVHEELHREVAQLAGGRYERKEGDRRIYRHGSNPGSVKLGGQRVAVDVPRVRDEEGEVALESYRRLHLGSEIDEGMFRRVLYGISCRNYEAAAESVPGAIGLSKSTVSERFIEVSSKQLRELQERDLSSLDVIAIFLDGKAFADDEIVIALGVTADGDKVFLGFIETDTENKKVISEFLRSLLARGLKTNKGLLAVIDGAKGLRAAVKKVFGRHALIQRCQWHKRENVVSYMPKSEQASFRKRLQKAYERPTYREAKQQLSGLHDELQERNQSAASSLQEGFEETLTLHRLGVFALIGRSFKTTNCIESVNSQAEDRCQRVDFWKNSNQKQRWLAAALLDIEPRLRKIQGYKHLHRLREALMKELKLSSPEQTYAKAA